MDRVYGYRSVVPVAAILMALLGGGCAGPLFYNEGNHKAAKNALEKVKALQVEGNATMTEMQANLTKSIQNQAVVFKDINKGSVGISCNAVLGIPLSSVLADLKPPADKKPSPILSGPRSKVDELTAAVVQNLQQAAQTLPAAKLTAKEAKEKLAQAKERLTKWNMKVALFSKMIELLPAAEALNNVATSEEWNKSFKALEEQYGTAKVEYVDADGKQQSQTLKEIVTKTWESADSPKDNEIKEAVQNVFTASPPGALVVIAALANDLAEIQQNEAQSAVAQWSAAHAALLEGEKLVESCQALAATSARSLESEIDETNKGMSVAEFLLSQGAKMKESGADQADISEKVQIAYNAAVTWAVLDGPVTGLVNEATATTRATGHQRSIAASAAAIGQHRAYVERSLEAVELYYASGVRPEKVGEFAFRLAELSIFAVILGVIP